MKIANFGEGWMTRNARDLYKIATLIAGFWEYCIDCRLCDKFDKPIHDGDTVDVQKAGLHRVFLIDAVLYFRPYGADERVSDYFRGDIVKVDTDD